MQKLYCKVCNKYQQQFYKYQAYKNDTVKLIPVLLCESVSIRGIARILKIAIGTVQQKIISVASKLERPIIPMNITAVEMDELYTYIGNKANQYWISYALCSKTKKVIDFIVGKRNKQTLRMVVKTLLTASVQVIKTDKLNIYKSLIPSKQHIASAHGINYIERHNLNLRTHLKRLSRRTICFSKSEAMLAACVKIYFWRSAN